MLFDKTLRNGMLVNIPTLKPRPLNPKPGLESSVWLFRGLISPKLLNP